MNFTSPLFLIGFPLVLAIYRKMPGRPHSLFSRQTFLLLASWMFYMGGSLRCFPLLLLVTLVTFLFGILIENARTAKNGHAKVFLSLVLVIVFTILFFFKYFGFLQDTLFQLIGVQGRGIRLPLPAGISFYTFQSISYCLDVYRGRRKAERGFRDFALFVSFFPQLVAGPIERADDLLPQLTTCPLPTESDTRAGAFYLLRGFFKKIVIADFVSLYVTALFDADRYSGPLTVLAGILFGFQIYADFSGYSDIALGAARLLGIRLHINFDSPYLADSIRDFWRRWHITLTSWFTDYVYIPLGGSRRGTAVHVRNVLIVFLLSGFWHGADWHFAAWGLYHGILLSCSILFMRSDKAGPGRTLSGASGNIFGRAASAPASGELSGPAEKLTGQETSAPASGPLSGQNSAETGAASSALPGAVRILRIALTFLATSLGWILFRASSVRQAVSMYAGLGRGWTDPDMLRAAFTAAGAPLGPASLVRIALIPVLLILVREIPAGRASGKERDRIGLPDIIAFLMACAILVSWFGNLAEGTGNDFIYFQF